MVIGLTSLLWNYFTVQGCDMHGRDSHGAIKRTVFYNKYENIKGNLQGIRQEDVVLKYGMKSREISHVLFYSDSSLVIDETTRIIVKKNPRFKITNFTDFENIRIFEFRGHKEPVVHPEISLFEVYLQENERWDL